jgi:hypothetical protein
MMAMGAPEPVNGASMPGAVASEYAPDIAKLMRYVDNWASFMQPATNQSLLCCQFFDGQQLTEDDKRELKGRGQPIVVINRVKPAVNGIVGVVERGKTDPKAYPREPTDDDTADLATDVLRYICDVNRFQVFKSRSFLDELKAGWTASITEISEDEEVVTTRIRWEEFIWDPASRENDARDARYLAIGKWMYVDDLQAEYPAKAAEIADAFSSYGAPTVSMEDRPFGGYGWVDNASRRVMVVEMYHREMGVWHRCKFIRTVALEYGVSAYLDKYKRPRCPIEAVRAYVDTQNRPYGVILDMLDPQREINSRRSWLLRALVVRQALIQKGAVEDLDAFRAQLAKTDGLIEVVNIDGVEILDRTTDISGQSGLLQEAKAEIDRQAPNPALQGRQTGDASGRALLARQQAGLLELSTVLSAFEEYIMRVYRQMWDTARQFWTSPKYIRITSDAKAPEYLMVNEPVLDPMTGQPAMQINPQTGHPEPVTKRSLAQLDVDIVIDSAPDVASIEEEQFKALMDLYPAVAQIDPQKASVLLDGIIASSPMLRDKANILKAMKGPEQPTPEQQQAQALQMEGAQAELDRVKSETAKNTASAMKTTVEAAHIVTESHREDQGTDHPTQDREQRDRLAQIAARARQEKPSPG